MKQGYTFDSLDVGKYHTPFDGIPHKATPFRVIKGGKLEHAGTSSSNLQQFDVFSQLAACSLSSGTRYIPMTMISTFKKWFYHVKSTCWVGFEDVFETVRIELWEGAVTFLYFPVFVPWCCKDLAILGGKWEPGSHKE